MKPLQRPEFQVDQALVQRGSEIFPGTCTFCHGPVAVSGGKAPDLRASPIVLSQEAFADVVTGGSRQAMGMPPFSELSEDDLLALRHYIRHQAEAASAAE